MRDPIELFDYPKDWIKRASEEIGLKEVKRRIESGLFILTEKGWLRRGITTGTTATAAALACLSGERIVRVKTPVGIEVPVKVKAGDGYGRAKKWAGDHAFDVTDGVIIEARSVKEGIIFGRGIGRIKGRPSVSEHVLNQLRENLSNFDCGVEISVVNGEKIAEKTGNPRLGIYGGISLLGSTGFVEPWCDRLLKTKIEISKQYDRIAVTTGRRGWKWALENLREFKPIVFGVHLDAVKFLNEEIVIVGLPSLIRRWAGAKSKGKILKKAKEINENVIDVIILEDLE